MNLGNTEFVSGLVNGVPHNIALNQIVYYSPTNQNGNVNTFIYLSTGRSLTLDNPYAEFHNQIIQILTLISDFQKSVITANTPTTFGKSRYSLDNEPTDNSLNS